MLVDKTCYIPLYTQYQHIMLFKGAEHVVLRTVHWETRRPSERFRLIDPALAQAAEWGFYGVITVKTRIGSL